ncbi:hypothetical protein FRZ44_07680 [Hypericibacter terrae]|uniref:Uncharacterized protein n=1 Tax=Hypericibacter terrae TaxID=2602015 RepID=A0A5J6MDH5_9PROT|nr:hypothetical protein [Hypericibacter terrae]QEX15484.1 hypothetical protein FRZ44_07680 [Hypericibacter terrae]
MLEDHWPISILGGELRAVSTGEKVTAFEIIFAGQPVSLAPKVEKIESGRAELSITTRDTLLPFVRMHLEKAFSYLQCYFSIEILIGEIETDYIAETEEEKEQIPIKAFGSKKREIPLTLTYDYFTRAVMAAEVGQAPEFEATLVSAARDAMLQERYIDSFRYSFLLMESLYGDGKFKAAQLKDALKQRSDLTSMVATALKQRLPMKRARNSDTDKLLASSPTVEAVIDHMVEKRGFYFHGNIKRHDAWQPHEQEAAEALCALSLEIAMLISHAAAAPMFDAELSKRHYDHAKSVGAIMTMNVKFRFREPGMSFDTDESMNIRVPGTKVTPRMAVYVAREFLQKFEDVAPIATLKSASCVVSGTGQEVFDISFHVGTDSNADQDGKN